MDIIGEILNSSNIIEILIDSINGESLKRLKISVKYYEKIYLLEFFYL